MKCYIELDEIEHFYKEYEDYKNNMYFLLLNDDIEKWVDENISGEYELDCESYYQIEWIDTILILFENEEDAVAFKLRWF